MDDTKELLTREIDSQIQSLATMENGSEEKASAVKDVKQLHDMKLEEMRLESDILQAKAEVEHRKRDRIIGYVISGVGIVLPIVAGLIFKERWYKRGFKFEEEGTYTSDTFQTIRRDKNPF